MSSELSCERHPTRASKQQRQHMITSSRRPTRGAFERRTRDVHARRPRRIRDFDDLSRRIVRCCILGARPLVIGSDRARGVARKLMRFSAHSIFRDDKNSRLVEPRVAKPPIEATNTSATRISPSSTPSVDAMPRLARGVECGHDMDLRAFKGT